MAPYEDDDVVGVPAEPKPPRLKLLVELVEVDVGKKRGQWSSLRGSHFRLLESFRGDASSLEELANQGLYGPVIGHEVHLGHEPVLRHVVEELGEVYVDYPPVSVVEELEAFHYRLLGASVGPEPVRRLREEDVGLGGHRLRYRLLYHPVPRRGYPEFPYPAAGLGYLLAPDGHGLVRSVPYRLRDFLPMRRENPRQFLGSHPVHAGRAPVGHDGPDGSFDVRFV